MNRVGEGGDGSVCRRTGDHEVERRCLQGGSDNPTVGLESPEAVLGVDGRMVAKRAGDSEHEIVARLVLEEERPSSGQERGRIVEPLDMHRVILYFIGNA